MLFVESKSLSHKIEGTSRTRLLEELQEKNLTPLIRSARLNCFDHVLLGPERIERSRLQLPPGPSLKIANPMSVAICFVSMIMFSFLFSMTRQEFLGFALESFMRLARKSLSESSTSFAGTSVNCF